MSKVVVHRLNLVVYKHGSNLEPTGNAGANQGFEMFEEMTVFMLSSLLADPNCMCLGIVTRNGIPVTFMMTTDMVTCFILLHDVDGYI